MSEEDFRVRLLDLLESQAEKLKQPPTVYYVDHWTRMRQPGVNQIRTYIRLCAVDVNSEIVGLDLWIRKALGLDVGVRDVPGTYAPDRGWRIDRRQHAPAAAAEDLIGRALKNPDYAKSIRYREII